MVRRTKEEAEETRRLLLKTALKLFSEKGINTVTLAQVAKAAGVTRGAIYWHFNDKADMLEAMWSSISAPLESIYRPQWEACQGDPLDLLENIACSFFLLIAGDAGMQQVFRIRVQAMGNPLLASHSRKVCEREQSQVDEVMRRAREHGSLCADIAPETASKIFTGYLDGIVSNCLLQQNTGVDWLAREAEVLAKTVIKGLRA